MHCVRRLFRSILVHVQMKFVFEECVDRIPQIIRVNIIIIMTMVVVVFVAVIKLVLQPSNRVANSRPHGDAAVAVVADRTWLLTILPKEPEMLVCLFCKVEGLVFIAKIALAFSELVRSVEHIAFDQLSRLSTDAPILFSEFSPPDATTFC